MKPSHFVLTVLGKDRAGIIDKVTGVLYRHRCNLEDVSMTILEGEFAMILVASLSTRPLKEKIEKELKALGRRSGLTFFWTALKGKPKRGEKHTRHSESYFVSAAGRDCTGIVHRISHLLGQHGLNITDLNARILGQGKQSVYTLLLEVDIPRRFDLSRVEKGLRRLQSAMGIDITFKPAERIEC